MYGRCRLREVNWMMERPQLDCSRVEHVEYNGVESEKEGVCSLSDGRSATEGTLSRAAAGIRGGRRYATNKHRFSSASFSLSFSLFPSSSPSPSLTCFSYRSPAALSPLFFPPLSPVVVVVALAYIKRKRENASSCLIYGEIPRPLLFRPLVQLFFRVTQAPSFIFPEF